MLNVIILYIKTEGTRQQPARVIGQLHSLARGPAFHVKNPFLRCEIQLKIEDKGVQLSSSCIFAKEALRAKKWKQ